MGKLIPMANSLVTIVLVLMNWIIVGESGSTSKIILIIIIICS